MYNRQATDRLYLTDREAKDLKRSKNENSANHLERNLRKEKLLQETI